jgi:hypothetical protein
MNYELQESYWCESRKGVVQLRCDDDGWSLLVDGLPYDHGWPVVEVLAHNLTLRDSGILVWDESGLRSSVPATLRQWHAGLPPAAR